MHCARPTRSPEAMAYNSPTSARESASGCPAMQIDQNARPSRGEERSSQDGFQAPQAPLSGAAPARIAPGLGKSEGERLAIGRSSSGNLAAAILGSIADLGYAIDAEGRFVYANPPLLAVWGLTAEEAIGKSFYELPYTDDLARKLHDQVRHVVATRLTLRDETSYCSPSGIDGHYEYTLTPIVSPDGEVYMVAGMTRDITERRRTESSLANLQRRLDASLLAAEVGVFECDFRAGRLFGDTNFAELYGITLDAEASAPIAMFEATIHPEDRAAVREQLDRALDSGGDYHAQYRITTGDQERWVLARGKIERGPDDGDRRVQGVVLDMTELERALRDKHATVVEHQRSARMYDTVLAATDDFAYVFDRDARFLFANRRLLEVWDKRLEDVVGKNCHELGYPDWHAALHDREVAQVIATKQPIRGEVPFTGASGISGIYDYIFTPVFGPDGEVEVIAGTTRDITERKAAEDDRERLLRILDNERGRLRAVVEQAPAFICVLRGPDHVFELANERYYEVVGKRDILGKPLREALPEVRGQGYIELLDRVYSTAESFTGSQMPVMLRRRNDDLLEQRFVDIVYQPLYEPDGSVSGVLTHGIDVTDVVQSKEALRATAERLRRAVAEAQAANQAKDRFLAVLSHELRTPLTPVALVAAALESDPRLPVDVREDIAMVRRNVDLETRLIDDLLDLSRVMSGKLRLDIQSLHVHRAIEHALGIVGPELEAGGIKVELLLGATKDLIHADPARIQQTLWNLLKNVVKFTPRGGRVEIRTSNAGDQIHLAIADTGEGIAAELIARIFDPFEQGSTQSARRAGGLGLGLAVAQSIVDLHGGSIHVESPGWGQGSTFTVRLPLVTSGAGTPSAAPEPRSVPSAKVRVLLVEDHADSATALMRLLCIDGMDVVWASSVAAALEVAGKQTFDVLVSDVGLPDGSGFDLVRALHRIQPIPAIAISGYGMEDDLRQSRSAGFAEHIVKPIALTCLRDAIRRLAASEA